MALASQCRLSVPVSATVASHAGSRACNKIVCKAVTQPAQIAATRRESLGFLMSLPLLMSGQAAQAVGLEDFRRAKGSLDSLDQARDDSEHYRDRFSLQGPATLTLEEHKQRAKESFARLQNDVKAAVDARKWSRVQADIRHQLGTLSFDLNKVAQSQGDKTARQQALQLRKAVIDSLADLDYGARKKSDSLLQEGYAGAVKAVGDAVANLG